MTERRQALQDGFFNMACELVDELKRNSHLFFLLDVDAGPMDAHRARARGAGETVPTYTAFVIKAVARALREHPSLNAVFRETPFFRRLAPLPDVTATVALEREVEGVSMVFAPQLRAPDQRSLADLTLALRHCACADVTAEPQLKRFLTLVRLSRWLPKLAGALIRSPRYSVRLWRRFRGGSFAVTSPGKYGGCDVVLPPWPWPLTFSFGTVKVRPGVRAGRAVPLKTMRMTITADRRLSPGAPLARFAETLRGYLECPGRLEPAARPATAPSAPAAASANPAPEGLPVANPAWTGRADARSVRSGDLRP